VDSNKDYTSKTNLVFNKTRNRNKNFQNYLTYSESDIQNKNIKDINISKDKSNNINTVKINLEKVPSKKKINVFLSYDLRKIPKNSNINSKKNINKDDNILNKSFIFKNKKK